MIGTGFLSNPRPSQGQSTPFAPRPDAGPTRSLSNAFGAAIAAPSVRNRAGIVTNPTITYPFLSRPWKDDCDKHLTEGTLLFVFRDGQHSTRNHGRGSRKSANMVVVADVPMINQKFQDATCRMQESGLVDLQKFTHKELRKDNADSSFFGVFAGGDDKKPLDGDLNGFLTAWSFVGVLRNESNPRGRLQRMLNVDVRGRSRVRNIWGKVRAGDRLYLQLQRGRDCVCVRPLTPKLDDDWSGRNWVLVPRSSRELDFAKNMQKHDECCLFPIGIVSNSLSRECSAGARKRALLEKGMLVNIPFIEILLGIACK